MSLLDRLIGSEAPKIGVHQFQAALAEWEDGALTRAEVIAAFAIGAAEETELDWLKARYQAATDKERFKKVLDNVLLLAEAGLVYDTPAKVQARLLGAAGG